MDNIIKMLDESLNYVSHELINNTIYITVVSNRKTLLCPDCKHETNKVHSRYNKSFQDLPIQCKKVTIIINNRNMFCTNENCNKYTFAERFDFIDAKTKKTRRLNEEIVRVSLTQSSISSSEYLMKTTVNIKKSSICNYLKKEIIINKNDVKYICIDDFAVKKRHNSGTVMIDINTRCIIDLFESRDTQDVANWLKEYPNIEIVVRDGSASFKAAIELSHPNAIQVNDRFHMIKNLVKAIKKSLQRLITGRIEIPLTSENSINRHKYLTNLITREKIIEVKKLRKEGKSYIYIYIYNQLQISTSTASKYSKIDDSKIPKEHISIREKEHIDAVNKIKCKVEKFILYITKD